MSLVIATNNDEDTAMRQGQSIFSAFSFRNSLSSVYKIPPNSQVCLQSAKVNLDGRINVTGSNSNYYDWFGDTLDDTDPEAIDKSTSYPILQQIGVESTVLELTTDEIAERVQEKHKEHYPNRMVNPLLCSVNRDTNGNDFLGYSFNFYNDPGDGTKRIPSNWQLASSPDIASSRFTWDDAKKHFQKIAGSYADPSVGIGLNYPLDTSGGVFQVDFNKCSPVADGGVSDCAWGVGLTRCCLNSVSRAGTYAPTYFRGSAFSRNDLGLGASNYFEDFGVHKNLVGELVVRCASRRSDTTSASGKTIKYNYIRDTEIKYWENTNSAFSGTGRLDIDGTEPSPGKFYDKVKFVVSGEQVAIYLMSGTTPYLITVYDAGQPKDSYFKPVSQTCWCLHPILYVGDTAEATEGLLIVENFWGVDVPNYDPLGNNLATGKRGWFEEAQLTDINGTEMNTFCKEVDIRRVPNEMNTAITPLYIQKGLTNDFIQYITAMITAPNISYTRTHQASASKLFGFGGRSFVTGTVTIDDDGDQVTALTSDNSTFPIQSIFVRLNGFGQQVLNARTGNKSTILAHLPTADSRNAVASTSRFYHEPNRDIWIDLNNPFELQTTEFGIDFVYSNEQYAKVLSGQSIVVLYFREKPK